MASTNTFWGVITISKTLVPTQNQERAVLAGVEIRNQRPLFKVQESLRELSYLAKTAGAKVVGTVTQRLERPSRYYLGSGKLEELRNLCKQTACQMVIFDDELTPTQERNLEKHLNIKVIDRAALILDIFGRHAKTREGQLQVELAQHQYLLPRLAGQWSHLERLGGGIGTRGPGESQIETDRRLIRRHIQKLRKRLEEVRRQRALYRTHRKDSRIPVVSFVGYTNAGKSTLFNTISKSRVITEAKLFSTLDPITRRVRLPSGSDMLLGDTVGFINKLPPALISAFHATLEELSEADLLLHVIDVSHSKAGEQAQVVEDTLRHLGLENKPRMSVLNKIDLILTNDQSIEEGHEAQDPTFEGMYISATKNWNVDRLLKKVEEKLTSISASKLTQVTIVAPDLQKY